MNSTEVVDTFRLEVNDLATPQLWSDDEAFEYLDDAQNQFCLHVDGIADATSSLTQLDITTTTDEVELSPLILKFRAGYLTSTGKPISIINYEDMHQMRLRFDGTTGEVQYLVIGLQAGYGKYYPYPISADTLQLYVDRLPLERITSAGSQELEIPRQHHTHLTLWMRARAYRKQDAAVYDKRLADEFEARFMNYCAEAKKQRDKAKHKTRVVKYGGI